VPSCEFFPLEALRTNALGTENMLNAAFGHGLGEVNFFMDEKVSEEVYVADGKPEAIGVYLGRQAIDKGSAQGLISALPFMDRAYKKRHGL